MKLCLSTLLTDLHQLGRMRHATKIMQPAEGAIEAEHDAVGSHFLHAASPMMGIP